MYIHVDTKCQKLPGCVHPVACCCRVDLNFQPLGTIYTCCVEYSQMARGKMEHACQRKCA